jgi:tetratricopeptide (TPR) repeat protein
MRALLLCLPAILFAGCVIPSQEPAWYYRDRASAELNTAMHFEANRDFEEAGRRYEDAARNYGAGAEGNEGPFLQAACYLKAGEMAEAADLYDTALARYQNAWRWGNGPAKGIALYRRGILLQRLKRPDEAETAFHEALAYIDSKPEWPPADWLRTELEAELKAD